MLKSNSLNSKRWLSFLLMFLLVFGFSSGFFSASAATVTQTDMASVTAFASDGTIHSSSHCRGQFFQVEPGTISITVEGNYGGGSSVRDVVAFVNEPSVGSSGGYQIVKFPDAFDNPLIITLPEGYMWIYVCVCYNATSTTALTITVESETTTIPDVPSYDGTTSGSSSVVTGIQQGYEFDGVRIDTTSSQLSASLVEETSIPVDNDEDGIADSYVLKSTYKVPVLVSCVVTNTSDKYAWLNDKTIGYSPQFTSNIPLLADAATTYSLCDIFYTSKGFADAVTSDGTIHFRFDDSNYYLGNVIIKPMSTLSASALLYYDVTVITTVPAQESFYSYLTAVAQIMRTTILNSVGLSGINAIQGMLEYIPTDSTSMGQQQINNSVVVQGQQTQQAIQALQTQQQQQFVEFTTPASGTDVSEFFAITDDVEGLSFVAVTNDIIMRFVDLFNRDIPPAELTFPAFGLEIQGVYQPFWESYTFSFTEWGQNFPVLVDAMQFATMGVLCFWLVRYCNRLITKIFGAPL